MMLLFAEEEEEQQQQLVENFPLDGASSSPFHYTKYFLANIIVCDVFFLKS